ncbi:MAG: type II toxin-antitoxin system VapC family toxin [Saprospiraceae bacterium]|nr:type II toxin-antitoxin system VapC family toxin [Saprospiraceae bacterium]
MHENQILVLCDTNIIIEFYKNNPAIVAALHQIGQENIAISVITAGELLYGALNKLELERISKDITHLHTLALNESIGTLALELLKHYTLSHKLSLPDALIAATALHYDIPLYTLNLKDFRPITGLSLYQPA